MQWGCTQLLDARITKKQNELPRRKGKFHYVEIPAHDLSETKTRYISSSKPQDNPLDTEPQFATARLTNMSK